MRCGVSMKADGGPEQLSMPSLISTLLLIRALGRGGTGILLRQIPCLSTCFDAAGLVSESRKLPDSLTSSSISQTGSMGPLLLACFVAPMGTKKSFPLCKARPLKAAERRSTAVPNRDPDGGAGAKVQRPKGAALRRGKAGSVAGP